MRMSILRAERPGARGTNSPPVSRNRSYGGISTACVSASRKDSVERMLCASSMMIVSVRTGARGGVFVTIASQRPNDISPTITSQAHNYFIHRLINERDLQTIASEAGRNSDSRASAGGDIEEDVVSLW